MCTPSSTSSPSYLPARPRRSTGRPGRGESKLVKNICSSSPIYLLYRGLRNSENEGIKEALVPRPYHKDLHNSAKECIRLLPKGACCYNGVDAGGILEDHPGYIQLMVHKHVSTRNQPCDALYRNSISGRASSSGQPGFSRRLASGKSTDEAMPRRRDVKLAPASHSSGMT